MTKSKFKAGKEFNTKWIIDWEYWVFFFVVFNLFFQSTNWFRISYFNCKTIPFIYAIREKKWKDWKFLKVFCSWQRGFTNRRVWILRNNLFEGKSKYERRSRKGLLFCCTFYFFLFIWALKLNSERKTTPKCFWWGI